MVIRKNTFRSGGPEKTFKGLCKNIQILSQKLKKVVLRASSPLVGALTKPFIGPFSGPIAPFQITNINALSCFGKLTSLLELTLDLSYCEGLLDLDPLSSLERCVNLKKAL